MLINIHKQIISAIRKRISPTGLFSLYLFIIFGRGKRKRLTF